MRVDLLLLLASVALLVDCAALNPADCDLGDPDGLSRCIKQLLIDSRPEIAELADPLHVAEYEDDGLKLSNIVIRGIAGFSVGNLSVTFPGDQQISVYANITWPHLRGDLDGRLRKCKRILWKKRCVTLRGRPDIFVGRTRGTLRTTLNVAVAADGKITVTTNGTDVSLDLASITVIAHLRGAVGWFNRLFKDPASKYFTKEAKKWWEKNKAQKVEKKIEKALDKVVKEKVSVHLSRLLKI